MSRGRGQQVRPTNPPARLPRPPQPGSGWAEAAASGESRGRGGLASVSPGTAVLDGVRTGQRASSVTEDESARLRARAPRPARVGVRRTVWARACPRCPRSPRHGDFRSRRTRNVRRRMSRRVILLSINVPAKSETVFPSHAPSARPVPPGGIGPRPPPKPRPGPEGRGAGNRRPMPLRTCTCRNRTAGLRELAGTQLELGATGGTGEQPEGVGTGGFRGARALPEVAAWASAGESTFCGAHGPCGMGGGARRRPRPQRTAVTSPEPQLSPSLPSVGGASPGFGAGHGRPSHLCGVTGLTGARALPCQARGGSV